MTTYRSITVTTSTIVYNSDGTYAGAIGRTTITDVKSAVLTNDGYIKVVSPSFNGYIPAWAVRLGTGSEEISEKQDNPE